MALIGTLRTKMTKVVVGFVFVAMAAFIVGGDLFGNGPRSIFSGDKNSVGEIAGHNVSIEEYQNYLQERETNYVLNFGRQPGEREQPQLRQEAWELLILKYGISPQFDKVGQAVTAEEERDMIMGKNVDANIKSSFADSAGRFDSRRLTGFLATLDNPENAQNRVRWNLFRANIIPGRERVKYENLLIKTNYVTDAEGERDYHNQNDVAEIKYLYVPFYAVSDSAVKATDSDLEAYYKSNKEHYKTEETRSLAYVTFPVVASAKDSAATFEDLSKAVAEFKASADDSLYAASQTTGNEPYAKYNAATLPPFLGDKSKLVAGNVIGPFLDGDVYKVVKIVKIGTDTASSARASHILIKWDNTTPEAKKEAKEKATKILNDIKKGAPFAIQAMQFSADESNKMKGGELPYFTKGQMVKPFEDAVFNAKKTGLLNDLVETTFGYHIINVTSVKDNTSYTIATVELKVSYSDETQSEALAKAQTFSDDLSGVDAFRERAKKENLSVYDANDLSTAERRINTLGEAREMITWVYKEGKVGTVSKEFLVNDNYVVAVMTGEVEAGYKPFAKVKDEILPIVKNQLKGKIIIEKLNAEKGTLDDMVKIYGTAATVKTSNDLKFSTNIFPSVGQDPIAVGTAFSLDNGKRSKAFAGETGVFVIEMQSKTIAPSIGDFTMFKNQIKQAVDGAVSYYIGQAVKDASDIKDRRYKFY